uniref:Uncharacterized protein n=1 Tax=Solanum tuberosum TaxID=4113 RepID=M1DRG1_SOLTU
MEFGIFLNNILSRNCRSGGSLCPSSGVAVAEWWPLWLVQRDLKSKMKDEKVTGSKVPLWRDFMSQWRRRYNGKRAAMAARRDIIPRTSGTNPKREGSSFLGFQACFKMVHTRYNGLRPVDPINAPAEESTARGHGRGRGRGRARGRSCGGVAHAECRYTKNKVHVENAHVNENPPQHNEEIEENVDVEDVEENGQEEEVLAETAGVPL